MHEIHLLRQIVHKVFYLRKQQKKSNYGMSMETILKQFKTP
jgi:hypothetical protein